MRGYITDMDTQHIYDIGAGYYGDEQVSAEQLAREAAAASKWVANAVRWEAVYRAAMVAAAQATNSGDWAAKRAALGVAQQACDGRNTANAKLIGAIFGQRDVPAGYARFESAGRAVSDADLASAEAVVAADADAANAAARRAESARRDAARAVAAERNAAHSACVSARLPEIGSAITVTVSYRLAKDTDGLAMHGADLCAVPGITQGEHKVRVTSHRGGRVYGKKYVFEGEIL